MKKLTDVNNVMTFIDSVKVKNFIPAHIKPMRKFKKEKRNELRCAKDLMMKHCLYGAAYTPAGHEIIMALRYIEEAIDKCSCKNWGR